MMARFGWRRSVPTLLLLPTLLLVVAACGDKPVAPGDSLIPTPEGDSLIPTPESGSLIPTPEGLLDTPSRITVDGHTFELQTYPGRDFMPGSSSALSVLARLVETDSLAIPSNVVMDYLWVVNGEDTWATRFSDVARNLALDHHLEEVARGGPKWEPGITVDAVVRVRAGSGEVYRILATDQRINRTD